MFRMIRVVAATAVVAAAIQAPAHMQAAQDAQEPAIEAERPWEFSSARDYNGHGTHTASTAGGNVAYLHEHGSDSGCGDNNWPKTFVYLAGWGFGHARLNGKPLYENYEMHFMVTQGIRDRKTLRVNYPMAGKTSPAGDVNPATQQIDFYIRSTKQDARNRPNREVHALLRHGGNVAMN